jgi:hypothetical protein
MIELCSCMECADSETPCSNDCDDGERCLGCEELAHERSEIQFQADCEWGRR